MKIWWFLFIEPKTKRKPVIKTSSEATINECDIFTLLKHIKKRNREDNKKDVQYVNTEKREEFISGLQQGDKDIGVTDSLRVSHKS